jgi:hypothetical protein
LRNAYQAGDLRLTFFTDADAAGNHFVARRVFGGFYLGYGGRVDFAGADWPTDRDGLPNSNFDGATFYFAYSDNSRGANQSTSWKPAITSIQGADAVAAGPAFTPIIHGSGMAAAWSGNSITVTFENRPAARELDATAAEQLVLKRLQGGAFIAVPSSRMEELLQSIIERQVALRNAAEVEKIDAGQVAARTQRVAKGGWYALEVGQNSAHRGLVDLEFLPDNKGKPEIYTLEDSGKGGREAAWIHFTEPGSLIVRAGGNEEAAVRGMDWPEFLAKWRDSTWQRGFLTVTLLNDVLPLMAYILVVCLIRFVAYWLIGKLPRAVRARATEEVDLMIAFAKWSGVGCYTLWTAKDILAGIGIVPAR